MAIEKVYSLKIEGADSVNDLRSAIEQLNDKLQTLNQTSKEYKATLEELTKLQGQLSDAMKGISDAAGSTNESIDGIKESLNEMGEVINTVGGEVIDSFVNGVVEGMTEAASSITVVNTNLQDLSQIDSVKDLKGHISDLRDKLVTLENGSDDYKATVQELINAQVKLKEVMNAGKNEMEAAEGSYNALSQRMSALKQVWKETTDEATRNEIGQQINEINNQLKALDASIGNSQRNVGNYKSALEGLDESFVGWKEELKQCKEALQQLDPSTQAYADTMARAAELTHQMSDQQEAIKYSSADVGDQLSNINGIASNLAAGYSAVNAAMGLFGEENEEVQQAMLKVQQAMALVQGLQGIDGFIKRTKGLSQSMGLVTKATKANTVATKANATAAKADAVAMGAEATATKAVIPAQMGLNAAMKANPIGFIIGLIASLIAIFGLLKDKIMEMIGSNKEMSAAFDKVKAVLAGFGNVIKKSVINPIKLAIIPIKTLAKVMIDVFKGDWSKIGDDIKEGFEETKNTVVDTINVVGAFKEGYDKKTAEQNEAARKKEAEARAKDRDEYIKDMEAKHKADWKYTAEGKKAYEEYYNALLEMYGKDTEEYKQALRDKEAYLRDFNEKAQNDAEDIAALELKLDIATYGEQIKYSEKYYNYEKKLYQDAMKEKAKYMPPLANIEPMPPEVEKRILEAEIRWKQYLADRNAYFKKKNDEFTKNLDKLVADFKSKFDALVDDRWKAVRGMMETLQALDAELKQGGETYKAIDEYIDKWKELFESIGSYDKETIQSILSSIRNDIISGATTNGFDVYIKAMKTSFDKTLYDMDKSTQTFVNNLELMFEDKKLTFGIQFPEDEMNRVTEIFNAKMDNANFKAAEVRERIDLIYETLAQKLGATTEEELAAMLPGFKKLLEEEQNYCDEVVRLNNEMVQKISDIQVKFYQNQENAEKNWYSNRLSQMELRYEKEKALAERNQAIFDGSNQIEALNKQRDYETMVFNVRLEMYQNLRDRYNEMSQDMSLTAEERANAEIEAAKITGEIIKTEMNQQIQMIKIQKDKIKEWKNAIKDAASNINSILSSIGDYWSSMIELERTAIETELEGGKISKEQAQKREEANKAEFEKYKDFQATITLVNTIAGAIGAFLQASSSYPPPWGQILGGVAAAAVAAAGAVEIAKIRNTQYGDSSSSAGGGGSTNFQLPSVMELEPDLQGRMTGMSDTDELNNAGGRGRGETAVRAWVVESDITASQELANKRHQEVTF